jgi:hypothetical protein
VQVEIADAIHQELLNWARWCWSGPWPHPLPPTECGSLEGGYRAPPQWDTLDERRTPTIRPNERRARVVQDAWVLLPTSEKAVLKQEYPAALAPRRIQGREQAARFLQMTLPAYERYLASAIRKVEAAFEVCE